MPNQTKVPYDKIEALYVAGSKTLKALSDEFKVSYDAVCAYGRRHDWSAKREKYRKVRYEEIKEQTAHVKIADKADFDSLTMKACSLAVSDAVLKLTRHADGESILKQNEIDTCMSIIERAQKVQYRTMDVPMPMQRNLDVTPEAPADTIITEEDHRKIVDEKIAATGKFIKFTATAEPGGNGGGNGNNGGDDNGSE